MIKTVKPPMDIFGGNTNAVTHSFGFGSFNYNSSKYDSQCGLVRVTTKRPCQICGKIKWCSYTSDGNLAICMNVASGSIKPTKDGKGNIHVLNSDSFRLSAPVAPKRVSTNVKQNVETERAAPERVHEVYTYLLEVCLSLSPNHGDILLNERGLSDTTIAYNLYATVPPPAQKNEVNAQLNKHFGDKLKGVPGFYRNDSSLWEFRFPRNGFFVPYRNVKRRIAGLQVRQDGNVKPKYYWISTPSENYKDGTPSGTHMHFVKPDRVKQTKQIIITEGALKADRISEFSNEAVVGIAGVSCFPDSFPSDLQRQIPELNKVIIAFDMDFWNNREVKTALLKLIRLFQASDLEVDVKTWDVAEGKGYDDYLFNEQGRG